MMKQALTFLSLVGEDGALSITNIAVIVCVVKIAIAPTFSITEVGALMVSLLNYAHRRHVGSKDESV